MSIKLSPQSQVRILNTLLTPNLGETYITYFKYLDYKLLNDTFGEIGAALLLQLILTFYEEYEYIPNEQDFAQYCIDDSDYQEFLTTTAPQYVEKFREFESNLFESVEETPYLRSMIKDYISQSYSLIKARQEIEALQAAHKDPKAGSAYNVIQQYSIDKYNFLKMLEADLGDKDKIHYRDLIREDIQVEDLKDSVAVKVYGTMYMYMHNVSVLMSPAKFFKSGLSQIMGAELTRKGYEVAYLDLENGFNRLARRLFQHLTKVTTLEVKYNIYLNREILEGQHDMILHNPYVNDHEEGQITYALEEMEVGDDLIPSLVFRKYVGLSGDGITPLWDILEGYADLTLENCSDAYQPYLDKVKDEFRKHHSGGFHLAHSKGVRPNMIRRSLLRLEKQNKYWREAGPRKKRVLMIDWMLLLDSDNKQDQVYLKSNDIYAALQTMAFEMDLHIIAIEGVANPAELKKWDVDLAAISPKFNKGIDYNAAHISVLAASETEKSTTRRMYRKEDRDHGSGTRQDVSYILVHPPLMQVKEITQNDHQNLFPELWEGVVMDKSSDDTKAAEHTVINDDASFDGFDIPRG